MSNIINDAIQELFVAMTTRWVKSDGNLATGVSRKKILELTDINESILNEIIQSVKEKASDLGMEIVEYMYEGDLWYTVRSNYVAPSELSIEEESTLAVIIELLEEQKEPITAAIPLEKIHKRLVGAKYVASSQLEKILRRLEYLGYITKKRKRISYSPRTLIEFSEIARKHIAEESSKLIF